MLTIALKIGANYAPIFGSQYFTTTALLSFLPYILCTTPQRERARDPHEHTDCCAVALLDILKTNWERVYQVGERAERERERD